MTTTSITDTLQAIIKASKTTKMADTKVSIAKLHKVLKGYKRPNMKDLLTLISNAKTKAIVVSNIEKVIALVDSNPKEDSKVLLKDLSVLIKIQIEAGQAAFLEVGNLLTQGLASIKENGGKQKDFLAWANLACGIKKAQAYKLMSVYKTFGSNDDFKGVSMRVLYTLSSQDDKVIEDSKTLATAGKLDTKALNKVIDKHTPVTKIANKKEPTVSGGTVAPSGTTKTEDTKESTSVTRTKESQLIEELQSTIASLTEELKAARTSKPAIMAMPSLPQFSSVLPYIVLGIDPEKADDKQAINKAYRAMAKIFTQASNQAASTCLLNARDTLLSAIK